MNLSRRAVLLAGAATALTPVLPTPGASAATRDLQPHASYWYPDSLPSGTPGTGITWRSLKNWSAATDTDLAFNAASVPLAARFTPTPANTTARSGQARVQSLVSFGPTSANPSQGAPTADYYALTHWAYLDELVFWGGSAGEGLILAPNAPIVDAAHRHGVPVLGNIFLPPVAFGGQLQWTRDLVQKDAAGRFPLARQLIALAQAYGFDGWFVNAETGGGDSALGADVLGFVKELKALSAAKGLRVTWYDAMTVNGTVSWQGALDSQNQAFFQSADTMFVDFRWSKSSLASSGTLAGQLGRNSYELWAGVDVESGGTGTSVNWDAIVPATAAHVTSIGFYRPEWTRNHLPANRTPGDFHTADDLFWTGASLDPSRPDTTASWRAPALSVADRSTVDALPFATVFNTGHGLKWYEDGEAPSSTPWNHLGLQDRLPSRRWVVRTSGTRPSVAFDFADAWRGGSSLLVSGTLDAPATLELYATRLPIGPQTVVEATHRADAGDVRAELAVATTEPGAAGQAPAYTFYPLSGGAGWQTTTVPLTGLSGRVRRLAVRLTGSGGEVRWRLGRLAVRDAMTAPAAPVGLRVIDADGGDLRFAWQAAPAAHRAGASVVRHHELYRILPEGTRRFLGGTCQSAYYVGGLTAEQGENAARFELRAVGELYNVSTPATTTHRW
ncbi:endo-beta-N-acetylglucosaminidase [Streptomyces sp. NPDC101149]|uniref:endo-beta-N-acetylglucosaminidase n=1 Tax=Streptomyces sp. NPDC101149 TaxID=3366113 RepID=UPI003805BC25